MINYDVVLSFAGEDREYVEQIAYLMKDRGIKVFYDRFEPSTLLGKDLYQYLDDVYKNRSKYFVGFFSNEYIKKKWTNHELRSAQERDFESGGEYILPIYLEDVIVPGLRRTIGHLNINDYSAEEIVDIIEDKLERDFDNGSLYAELTDKLEIFVISYIVIGSIKERDLFYEARNDVKSFLLENAYNLNRDIYALSYDLIDYVEHKFSLRKERRKSVEENVIENFTDVVFIYANWKKLKAIIQYYVENDYSDNIDIFAFCEQSGFYDKLGEKKMQELSEEIMVVLMGYYKNDF